MRCVLIMCMCAYKCVRVHGCVFVCVSDVRVHLN